MKKPEWGECGDWFAGNQLSSLGWLDKRSAAKKNKSKGGREGPNVGG